MKWAIAIPGAVPDASLDPADAAERYGLSADTAQQILAQVERQYLPGRASRAVRAQFRRRLHVEELMLARACARGQEAAWEEFWRRYRTRLRQAARALTRETERGNELADGLFAELFGLRMRDGERISKLDSYTGLGSLEGWLCALLAQGHVDQWRRERRWVRLDSSVYLQNHLTAPPAATAPGARLRAHLESALETVLGSASAPDRLLLSFYFLDELTLAQIGALMNVHESTVSRRLERVLARLRRQTRRELMNRGLGASARDEALDLDPQWLHVDVRKCLQATAAQPGVPHGL